MGRMIASFEHHQRIHRFYPSDESILTGFMSISAISGFSMPISPSTIRLGRWHPCQQPSPAEIAQQRTASEPPAISA
jgi:hypothetical protein